MIDNPDAEKESYPEEIWAVDEAAARRQGEIIASNRSSKDAIVRVKSVRQMTKRPSRNGTYRFECQLEIEYQ